MQQGLTVECPDGITLYGWYDTVYDVPFPVLFATDEARYAACRQWDHLIRFCADETHERVPVVIDYDPYPKLPDLGARKRWEATYCPTCAVLTSGFEPYDQQDGATADPAWWTAVFLTPGGHMVDRVAALLSQLRGD